MRISRLDRQKEEKVRISRLDRQKEEKGEDIKTR